MSRSYSAYLLFENVLDNLPDSNAQLLSVVDRCLNPNVSIVEENCSTTLGKIIDTNYEAIGYIELATGIPITENRIKTLLGKGQYTVAIRNTFCCISKEGFCRKCYAASFPDKPAAAVGDLIKINNRYVVQSQTIVGDGKTTEFMITTPFDSFTSYVIYPSVSISFDTENNFIVFPEPPEEGTLYTIRFYNESLKPYFSYMSKGYAGSLMGIKALDIATPAIKHSLIKKRIGISEIGTITEAMGSLPAPENLLQYYDDISDPLEKFVFGILLYCLYSNVS